MRITYETVVSQSNDKKEIRLALHKRHIKKIYRREFRRGFLTKINKQPT